MEDCVENLSNVMVKQQSLALSLLKELAISNGKVIWSVKYMTADPDHFFPSVCLEMVSIRTCLPGTEVKLTALCSHRYFSIFLTMVAVIVFPIIKVQSR